MRLFVLGCLMAAATLRAAPQQPDKQELYRMLDEIRASLKPDFGANLTY